MSYTPVRRQYRVFTRDAGAQANGRPIAPRDDWEEWKTLPKIAGVGDARVHDGSQGHGYVEDAAG